MSKPEKAPLIGIVSCQKELESYKIQSVNEFYLQAIKSVGGIPVILPAGASNNEVARLLSVIEGVLLPGSHSNVSPEHYGATHHEPYKDEGRDELSFTIIRQCIEQQIPIMGICRGFQEMNVALGGTLHPAVHEIAGHLDHRESDNPDFSVKYAPVHAVHVSQGGVFQQWLGDQQSIQVNSLHGQGVRKLASDLRVEALAPDGLVEAFSMGQHPYFVGVQWHPEWHPEWQAAEQPFSRILFEHFISSVMQNRK